MEAATEGRSITSEELKKHNKPGDLWVCIHGRIYDVSKWASIHPGGEAPLLSLAGEDITDAFIAYHPRSAWAQLGHLSTGYRLKNPEISEISKDYRRLMAEFTTMGLFEKKGHGVMVSFSIIFFLFAACIYNALRSESVLASVLYGSLMGLLWVQTTYLGHDSGHYQIMPTRSLNIAAQMITGNCITGISIAWWKWTHNAHHIACNSLDHDPDVQHMPFFAISSRLFSSITSQFYSRKMTFDRLSKLLISYQHWTFYPVMCVGRFNLFAQTFMLLFSSRVVPYRAANIAGVMVFWVWFPLLVWALPQRVAFVVACFVTTSIQHVQFCLNHFPADVYLGGPARNDWFERQTKGTIDIACPPWMDWFHGGLQFQLEHHLFPRLPRCHFRSVAPAVRELCKKHGLPYRSLGFWDANVATIRTLKTAAIQARGMVWEAVNTHG